jgi:hypothetical protein
MHPNFHTSLLEQASKGSENVTPRLHVEVYEEDSEVEKILDERRHNGEKQYLVKWKNYDDEDNQWEPARHLKNSQRLLQQNRKNLDPYRFSARIENIMQKMWSEYSEEQYEGENEARWHR